MSYVAPAGTPLTFREIGRGLAAGWMDAGSEAELRDRLAMLSATARAWPVVSGRAAMTVALKAMARCAGGGRDKVIIPAYTCYSVPAAIQRAGLVPVPCDVDPHTLSLDLDHLAQLRPDAAIGLVTANLFGMPNDLVEIESIAGRSGIFLLDDAAQSLGASLAGRPVGGFGDVGLYSFDKGKNISTIQGGALVARTGPLLDAIEHEWQRLPAAGLAESALTTAKLLPYSMLLKPSRYGLVRRVPMLRLGETRYDTGYPITRMNRGLAGLALGQLARIIGLQEVRAANASALRHSLEGLCGLRAIELVRHSEPAYPRFPLRAATRELRDELVSELNRAGIGATRFYPAALVDVPEVACRMPPASHSYSGAREVAATILTLPTHPYCPAGLAVRARQVIADACSQ